MRILFTTTAGLGHFHPLVPLAQAALRAGHHVAVACPPALGASVAASGFQALCGEDLSALDAERAAAMTHVRQLPPRAWERGAAMLADVFVGIDARRALPQFVAACQHWQPDLIVREECEFAGAIAAELLDLPHARVQVTALSYCHERTLTSVAVRQRLHELRAAWLPFDPTLALLHNELCLSFDPPALLDPATPQPPMLQHLRAAGFDRSSADALPGWLAPACARPLILVTLGSEAAKMPGLFPDVYALILAGLRDVAGTVIATVGRDRDPAELGPQPDHVHVERYVPQSLVLPHYDLLVHHGGHNTVLAALQHGLPQVIVPLFADQFDNAGRCVALGVAETIDRDALTPERISAAVNTVVHDRRFGKQARRLHSQMQASPPISYGVQLLEHLVAAHALRTPPGGGRARSHADVCH